MTLRTGNKGFTMIEVMVAASVLAFGILFIYLAYFTSLDAFAYCTDTLNVAPWLDEKIWQVQDDLGRFGFLAYIERKGSFRTGNRNFYWNLSCGMVGEAPELDLYEIDLELLWQMGTRKMKLSRTAYATYDYEEED